MISVLCGLHVKHTGHPGGLFTFSVGRRHQFNLARGIKSINRGNTDIAKSPWLRAVLGTRVLTLKHQKLPNPEQHTIPDLMGSSSQAMPAALEGREPKRLQSTTGCPKAPHASCNDAAGAVVSTPSQGTALGSLSPIRCTWPTVLGHVKVCAWFRQSRKVARSNPIAQNTKVSCHQGQWKLQVEIFWKKQAGLCQSTH